MASIKSQTVRSTGKDVERLESSYTAGGNVKWYSQFVKQFDSFVPDIPLLGTHPRAVKI